MSQHKKKFITEGSFSVYILECSDGSFYTGQTNDLKARLTLHEKGRGAKYVRSRLPFKLIYTKPFHCFRDAFQEEVHIKSLTRKEKETLVFGCSSVKGIKRRRAVC